MSPEMQQLLEAIDGAFAPSLAATLTGMTLTAASLLATLVKNQGDKVKDLREKKMSAENQATSESDPALKIAFQNAARAAASKYEEALSGQKDVKNTFQALLLGFGAFTVNLVLSLTLDPNVEKSLLGGLGEEQAVKAFIDHSNYASWLSADVTVSLSSLAVGLAAICYGAKTMARVIPRL